MAWRREPTVAILSAIGWLMIRCALCSRSMKADGPARRLVRVVIPPRARRWARRIKRKIGPNRLTRRAQGQMRRIRRKVVVIRFYGLMRRAPIEAARFMLRGRELDNFTYQIANEDELAPFLEEAVGIPLADAVRYMAELKADSDLRDAIEANLRGRTDRNPTMPYGRRMGWYAIVRSRKPNLVVETGVHDGLGSTVLLRALARNAEEGYEGSLVSFDPAGGAGWIIPDFLRSRHRLEIDPAPLAFGEALRGRRVDFFIHDSDHRYQHETDEFEAIWPLAAPGSVLLSDHAGTAFPDFCERRGLRYRLFKEVPRHWYPGAGIGVAMVQ